VGVEGGGRGVLRGEALLADKASIGAQEAHSVAHQQQRVAASRPCGEEGAGGGGGGGGGGQGLAASKPLGVGFEKDVSAAAVARVDAKVESIDSNLRRLEATVGAQHGAPRMCRVLHPCIAVYCAALAVAWRQTWLARCCARFAVARHACGAGSICRAVEMLPALVELTAHSSLLHARLGRRLVQPARELARGCGRSR
jgi:hypothetical protein